MFNRLQGVFKSLHALNVKYVVIGGVAAILHGVPRSTFDVDVLIEATPDNARRFLLALERAGFASATETTPEELIAHEITIFRDRARIDVQTATPGLQFESAWARKLTMTHQGETFYVLSREDLVASKKAANRPRDREDVQALEDRGEA
jgi:hypothetical protein